MEDWEQPPQWWPGWPSLLILGLLVALYGHIFAKLVYDWYSLPNFSHGFLVPVFAGYLLWTKRAELRATPVAPSGHGLLLVVAALALLVVGEYGAELFSARLSFLFLAAGVVLTFYGWAMLREIRFALFVLLLAIPIPAILFNHITLPLQLLASRVASDVLPFCGVPVIREGNVIQLPSMQLEVAEACSGIRSLMSLLTLAVFYGNLAETRPLRRVLLAAASLPIAVAANAARIVGTGICVQYWGPDKAEGFFHEFSGWAMFIISFLCLYLVHSTMKSISRARKDRT
jgi:exosortase